MASVFCALLFLAFRLPPSIDLYRKNPFSTRACSLYPDSFCHSRRPTLRIF